MKRQPRLVVHGCDLVRTHKNERRFLHNNFYGSQDNIVHRFWHGLINGIGLVFVGAILHL